MKNIYLIGMPGCGKSTIGRRISREIGAEFIDLDDYIINYTDKSISELFEVGESYFRDVETDCLIQVAKMDNVIIATGGGIIERRCNAEIMKNSGKVIFIHTTPEQIMKNSALDGRPLLKDNKNRIFELFEMRYDKYKKASHVTVDNMRSIDETINEVIKEIIPESL